QGHHHLPRTLAQPDLKSTTHGQPRRRRPGRQSRSRPHRQTHVSPHRHPVSHFPLLEPLECDTSPVAFSDLGFDARLIEGVRDLGFVQTRPIQSAVIPLALAGDDLIACAETGTGKTAAFVIPMLQYLLTTPARHPNTSRALVLAPTRELAVQIEDEIHGLSY